jgi:hypothetical protein
MIRFLLLSPSDNLVTLKRLLSIQEWDFTFYSGIQYHSLNMMFIV